MTTGQVRRPGGLREIARAEAYGARLQVDGPRVVEDGHQDRRNARASAASIEGSFVVETTDSVPEQRLRQDEIILHVERAAELVVEDSVVVELELPGPRPVRGAEVVDGAACPRDESLGRRTTDVQRPNRADGHREGTPEHAAAPVER